MAIRSLIRSPIRSGIRSPISGISKAISRYFSTFDSTAQARIGLKDPIVLGLQWEIQADFSATLDDLEHIWGGAEFGLRIEGDGTARLILPRKELELGARYPLFDTGPIDAHKLNSSSVIRDGDDFTITINGVSETFTFSDIDLSIPLLLIGSWRNISDSDSTYTSNGVVSNVKAWTGGDSSTGSLVLDMPIDEDRLNTYNQVAENKATTSIDVTLEYGYATVNASDASVTYDQESNVIEIIKNSTDGEVGWNFNTALDDTKTYILTFDMETVSGNGGSIGMWTQDWQSAGSVTPFNVTDSCSLVVDGVGRVRFRINVTNIGHMRFSNIKLREVENVGKAVNFIESDSEIFTKVDNEWLGAELVSQALWESPSNVDLDEWSYDANTNTWSLAGNGDAKVLTMLLVEDQPPVFKIAGSCIAISGTLTITQSSFDASHRVTEIGSYSRNIILSEAIRQQFKRASGIVSATITRPSFKRLIEVAS